MTYNFNYIKTIYLDFKGKMMHIVIIATCESDSRLRCNLCLKVRSVEFKLRSYPSVIEGAEMEGAQILLYVFETV